MIVELWRMRLEIKLNPKIRIGFVPKKKRNKKVSDSMKKR